MAKSNSEKRRAAQVLVHAGYSRAEVARLLSAKLPSVKYWCREAARPAARIVVVDGHKVVIPNAAFGVEVLTTLANAGRGHKSLLASRALEVLEAVVEGGGTIEQAVQAAMTFADEAWSLHREGRNGLDGTGPDGDGDGAHTSVVSSGPVTVEELVND